MIQVGSMMVHCGLCLNSNFKMPNYDIYIASFFDLFEVEKVNLFFPFPVVLPGGDGNDRPTGKFNKTKRKEETMNPCCQN